MYRNDFRSLPGDTAALELSFEIGSDREARRVVLRDLTKHAVIWIAKRFAG